MTKRKPHSHASAPAVISEPVSTTKILMVAIATLFTLLIGLISWLGNGLIAGQSAMREEIIAARGQLAQYRSDIENARTRADRTNDRQIEQDRRLTVIETRLDQVRPTR